MTRLLEDSLYLIFKNLTKECIGFHLFFLFLPFQFVKLESSIKKAVSECIFAYFVITGLVSSTGTQVEKPHADSYLVDSVFSVIFFVLYLF